MGLPERLGETAVAERHSAHIHPICDGRSLWNSGLFCRRASQLCHDCIVISRNSVWARIPVAAFHGVCRSIPNHSFDIANTCISQGMTSALATCSALLLLPSCRLPGIFAP